MSEDNKIVDFFEGMFLIFILEHCSETSDGDIIGNSFKDCNSINFKEDFNTLIELFLTQNFNESYIGLRFFNKEDLKNKLQFLRNNWKNKYNIR